ncbi:hypothetical protein NC651_022954 [Populus alba x Populus x berolinensis]|nr:hypothetical protein NC651_022954 [Populus alba x Populus x berolinensis]
MLAVLDLTALDLNFLKDSSRSFIAPTGWSGRFWARTGCNFDESGTGSCSTGDCGSGQVECNGLGASPPATLAEFTLGSGGQDFYDVSLVDGGEGDACKSACEAFGSPEYCYQKIFKLHNTNDGRNNNISGVWYRIRVEYAGTGSGTESGAGSGTGSGGETMLADGSWLAGLAMGDSYKTASPSAVQSTIMAFTTTLICSLMGACILPLSGRLTDSLIQIAKTTRFQDYLLL